MEILDIRAQTDSENDTKKNEKDLTKDVRIVEDGVTNAQTVGITRMQTSLQKQTQIKM